MVCLHTQDVECPDCARAKDYIEPNFWEVQHNRNLTFEQGQKIIELLERIEKLLGAKQ